MALLGGKNYKQGSRTGVPHTIPQNTPNCNSKPFFFKKVVSPRLPAAMGKILRVSDTEHNAPILFYAQGLRKVNITKSHRGDNQKNFSAVIVSATKG